MNASAETCATKQYANSYVNVDKKRRNRRKLNEYL